MKIQAVMISCAQRKNIREQTLQNLARTDWGKEAVHVQMDVSTAETPQERIEQTSRLALEWGLASGADYLLFLEDDLAFNRHLRHNLACWKPLQNGEVTLGSLYDPNIGKWQHNKEENWFIADPNTIYGSQAFLVSPEAAAYFLEHWTEVPGMQDIKMPRLAGKLGKAIYYHTPSLVEHVGKQSVWGGHFHQAINYDEGWKAQS